MISKIFKIIVWSCLIPIFARADVPELTQSNLLGQWRYYKKIYMGQDILEPSEATLRLFFSFYADGTDRLSWFHDNESDWCERTGIFAIDRGYLLDEVTWVNPRNSQECASDPDMQPRRRAITPVTIDPNGDLNLHLFLGDEPLVMVWKKLGG